MVTDGAGEFRRAFADLFAPHTATAPSRSETNSVAERNIQSLSNCVRALLEQSGLEQLFWPYVARDAALSLNIREDAGGNRLESCDTGRSGRALRRRLDAGCLSCRPYQQAQEGAAAGTCAEAGLLDDRLG
eukprot:5142258-Alexandrium_andersonii.AAC.1